MKNKIVSLSVVFAFMACILCAPIHVFLQNFYKSALTFEKTDIKGFSKNIVFSADKIATFEDFTQNIKTPKKEIFDFSDIPAVFSKAGKQKFISSKGPAKFIFGQDADFANVFSFADADKHRARTCHDSNTGILFIFFMLIYIGMLRAVYLNKNILSVNNKKPLFA